MNSQKDLRKASVIFKVSVFSFAIMLQLSACMAATWYVRPAGGSYGTENGTSYANAWDGFSSIVWGTGGVSAGDTLFVCGDHCEKLLVQASGTSASRIYIRGDYAGASGRLIGWKSCQSNQWTSLGNGLYVYDTRVDAGVSWGHGRAFFVGGAKQLIATDNTCSDGVWYKNCNLSGDEAYKIYFRPSVGTPADYILAYSVVDHAVEINDQDYLYIRGFSMYGHNSYTSSILPNAVICANGVTRQIYYVVIENCTISDAFGSGVEVWNGRYAYVRNNEIFNCMTGIYFRKSTSNSYIQKNNVHNIAQRSRYYGADHYGIAIGSSGNNCNNTVEYNTVSYVGHEQTGLAYDSAVCGWNASIDQYNVWRYNTIHDNYGGGLNLGSRCGGSVAAYNVIYNNGNTNNNFINGGIYINSSSGSAASVYIYNNTVAGNQVYNTGTEGQIFGHYSDPTKLQMKNNIISTIAGVRAFIMPYPANLTSDYNIFYAPGSTDPLIKINGWSYTKNTFSTYQSYWAQDGNSGTDNPLLNADMTLQSGSPAVNAGDNIGATWDDGLSSSSSWPSGVTLLDQDNYGSAWEIGACVYSN